MTGFPDGFLWGASTAGHQVEGGNVSADLWPMEWAEDSIFTEPSGDACDHYHRYPEDIAMLSGLGLNAYRFSIEWSRIEPEPGYFSRAALDHYRRMIACCLEQGVTPVVSFNHFTTPRWFAGDGGWGNPQAADLFGRYVQRATQHVGDLLSWATTLNEPNLITMLQHTGVVPMGVGERGLVHEVEPSSTVGLGGFDATRYRSGHFAADVETMAKAHRRAVEAIKSGPGAARVGWTLALIDLQLGPGGEERLEAARQRAEIDWLEVSRDDDFVGVQTYSRQRLGPDGAVKLGPEVPTMLTGWEVYPPALEHSVRLAAEIAQVPVLVTENGMATSDDQARITYTQAALEGLARCIEDGVDVRGYLHWTLLDNFEWMSGYRMTFGLVSVDRDSFVRTVKPSGHWLGSVARANRVEPVDPNEGVLDPWVAEWLEANGAMVAPPAEYTPEYLAATRSPMCPFPTQSMAKTTDAVVDGVPIRIYEHDHAPTGLVVFFHGGGFCSGSIGLMENIATELAHCADATVVSVEYRLAPEHPYPAALEDCTKVTRWALDNAASFGVPRSRVAVAGESAGGNLATTVAMRLLEDEEAPLAGQVLIYPALDGPAANYPSRREFDGPMLGAAGLDKVWAMYAGDRTGDDDPLLAPMQAKSLAGLPPALVILGGCDFLRDEGRHYVQRLQEDGVPAEELCCPGQPHGFMNLGFPAAAIAYARIGPWLRDAFDAR